MIQIRKAEERGRTVLDWLESFHTFSFGDYIDPAHTHFRSLRVLNEDRVQAGGGFHPHSHRDMEIITYILEGALEHKDSLGHGSVIRAGEIQRMSAGTGITHSEINASLEMSVHLLQIWILPDQKGIEPGYEQKTINRNLKNKWQLIASSHPQPGAVKIHQDAALYTAWIDPNRELEYTPKPGRHVWVQLVRGKLSLNRVTLKAGDGAGLSRETAIAVKALQEPSEILLFDLA